MNDLNELYERYMKLTKDVNNISNEIKNKRDEFDKSIKGLNDELFIKRAELDMINSQSLAVRLGDLIDELEKIFNLDRKVDKINYTTRTTINYFGKKSADELIKINNDSKYSLGYNNNLLVVNIDGTKKTARYNYQPKSFSYSLYLPIDLEAIQCDGKNLLEHSSIEKSRVNGSVCYTVVVDKNIDDLILNIDIKTLLGYNNPGFYPADKFRDAVGNCLEKENTKVKKRQP